MQAKIFPDQNLPSKYSTDGTKLKKKPASTISAKGGPN